MSLFANLTQGINTVQPKRTTIRSYDLALFITVAALLTLSLLIVYSASIALADKPHYDNLSRYFFVTRHSIFLIIKLIITAFVWLTPITIIQQSTLPVFDFTVFLLFLVFSPNISHEANSTAHWLNLKPVNFQPSKLMKVIAVTFTANYMMHKQQHMDSFINNFIPMAIAMAMIGILLLLKPDLGTLIIIITIAIGVLFLNGINAKVFSNLASVLISTFFLLI